MARINGTYKTLVAAVLIPILLGLAAWGGRTLIAHERAITAHEIRQDSIEKWLLRVEKKLDRALGVGD